MNISLLRVSMRPRQYLSAFLTIFIAWNISPSDAFKVLLLPLMAKSHVFPMFTIGNSLAARGHEVTIVLGESFPLDVPEVKVGQRHGINRELFKDHTDDYETAYDEITARSFVPGADSKELIRKLVEDIQKSSRYLLIENESLLKRLEKYKFDLVVVDASIVYKSLYLIPHRLGVPYVTYSDFIDPLVARVPWLPSFVPVHFTPYTERMTFIQRLRSVFMFTMTSAFKVVPDSPLELFDEYRRLYGDFDSLDDLAARSLLWLNTREHVVDYARPSVPHIIDVGGLTFQRSTGELSSDIIKFIEEAPNGTIVVSFGSIASSLPRNFIQKMFDAFRRLDADGYRFVFRLKNAEDVEIPQNVMIRSWLPQSDLLGHGSVKLFITHCGNSGQYEAVYHAKPMIGVPLFGDQAYNANRMEYKGFGISLDVHTFTADDLVNTVRRILTDGSFKDRVSKASLILRDDPQSPAERATYWIEHVCRFGGDHLRSAGQDLPLYAYLMLDVLVVVLVVIVVSLCCAWKAATFLLCRCFRKHTNLTKKREKMN